MGQDRTLPPTRRAIPAQPRFQGQNARRRPKKGQPWPNWLSSKPAFWRSWRSFDNSSSIWKGGRLPLPAPPCHRNGTRSPSRPSTKTGSAILRTPALSSCAKEPCAKHLGSPPPNRLPPALPHQRDLDAQLAAGITTNELPIVKEQRPTWRLQCKHRATQSPAADRNQGRRLRRSSNNLEGILPRSPGAGCQPHGSGREQFFRACHSQPVSGTLRRDSAGAAVLACLPGSAKPRQRARMWLGALRCRGPLPPVHAPRTATMDELGPQLFQEKMDLIFLRRAEAKQRPGPPPKRLTPPALTDQDTPTQPPLTKKQQRAAAWAAKKAFQAGAQK